jgi:hypothetical protein
LTIANSSSIKESSSLLVQKSATSWSSDVKLGKSFL